MLTVGRGRHKMSPLAAELMRLPGAKALAYFPAGTKVLAMQAATFPKPGVYLRVQYKDGTEEVKFIPQREGR